MDKRGSSELLDQNSKNASSDSLNSDSKSSSLNSKIEQEAVSYSSFFLNIKLSNNNIQINY